MALHQHFYFRRNRLPPPPVLQEAPKPYSYQFHSYDSAEFQWTLHKPTDQSPPKRDEEITIITWNLCYPGPGPKARATAAIEHLHEVCGDTASRIIIMLQEVRLQSLEALVENDWVKRNFKLSNVQPPEDVRDDKVGETFVMHEVLWTASQYFTVMLVSNDLPITAGFRVPLKTGMGRDVLAADILVPRPERSPDNGKILRVCTTHLESLFEGRPYRKGQLSLIASLLRESAQEELAIVGGIVAGDFNAIDSSEHEYPKSEDVQLQDAWECGPKIDVQGRKAGIKDLTNGLAKGYTWGYQQENGRRSGKRLDKILFTGLVDLVSMTHSDELTRGLRRLGVGLQTTVEAYRWEYKSERVGSLGQVISKPEYRYISVELKEKSRREGRDAFKDAEFTTTDTWVSDHYGLVGKFRIL